MATFSELALSLLVNSHISALLWFSLIFNLSQIFTVAAATVKVHYSQLISGASFFTKEFVFWRYQSKSLCCSCCTGPISWSTGCACLLHFWEGDCSFGSCWFVNCS